jgi:hypothetical protein
MNLRFEDPRQERIYGLLLHVLPGPAAFYRDACVLRQAEFPLLSTSHLVHHLLREANSAVRAVIEAAVPASMTLPPKGVQNRNAKVIRVLAAALGLDPKSESVQRWLRVGSLQDVAHRDGLAPPRPVDAEARRAWEDYDVILDAILPRFLERFVEVFFPLMDRLATLRRPTREDITIFLGTVPQNPVTLQYFCQRATPGWMAPLREKGFFREPPAVARDEEAGTSTYMWWPASRYLARMAAQHPETAREVVDLMVGLPPTDNFRVYVDCAEAVTHAPPHIAAAMAPKVTQWLEATDGHLLPSRVARLMVHLARGGEAGAALEITRALLGLVV